MNYIYAGLLMLSIGIALRLAYLLFMEKINHNVCRYEAGLRSKSLHEKLRVHHDERRTLEREHAIVHAELVSLKERHGQLKAVIRANLGKLEGQGFRRKNTGPLERSAGFKRLRESAE